MQGKEWDCEMWNLLICKEFRSCILYLELFCELHDQDRDPCTEQWQNRCFICIIEWLKLNQMTWLLWAPWDKSDTLSQSLYWHLMVTIWAWLPTLEIWLRKCNSLLQVGERRNKARWWVAGYEVGHKCALREELTPTWWLCSRTRWVHQPTTRGLSSHFSVYKGISLGWSCTEKWLISKSLGYQRIGSR